MRESNFIWVWGRATLRRSAIYQVDGLRTRVESACCRASLPACLMRVTQRRWWHSAVHGRVGTLEFSSWTSLVTRFILFMAGGGGQDRPEWGRGRRLTQLRGIASGGCLDDPDWKSTIVPSTHAVSEAYLSFKNPTLSRKPTQLRARLASTAEPAARLPIPSPAHSIICRSRLTNRMPGLIAKPAKPLLLVSASSTTEGSAPQRLVVHIP